MSKTCVINGCGNKHLAKGLCRKHYLRQYRGNDPEHGFRGPLAERFWSKVEKGKSDACWRWLGDLGSRYGRIGHDGMTESAHRLSYRLTKGPIPPGMFVLHACDNPWCVNPAHLSVGTPKENMHDMIRKGRAVRRGPKGQRSSLSKLDDAAVIAIRASGADPGFLAREFGVHARTIDDIRRRKTWRHLP